MNTTVIHAETLNLPEIFAAKFQGKKVELVDNGDTITIKPVSLPASSARGLMMGSVFSTDSFLEQKRIEKEIEYGS